MRFCAITLADPGGDLAVLEVVGVVVLAVAIAGPLLPKGTLRAKLDLPQGVECDDRRVTLCLAGSRSPADVAVDSASNL